MLWLQLPSTRAQSEYTRKRRNFHQRVKFYNRSILQVRGCNTETRILTANIVNELEKGVLTHSSAATTVLRNLFHFGQDYPQGLSAKRIHSEPSDTQPTIALTMQLKSLLLLLNVSAAAVEDTQLT